MYSYAAERQKLFTDYGRRMLLAIRDHARNLIRESGAATLGKIIDGPNGIGDSFVMLACVDRLVEIGDLREIVYGDVPAQVRIFVWNGRSGA